ncbi:Dbl homology domain-containing protein [Phycomyces nitens]|nr:Dbl homology domain-containing protein [Phycomyces nitens]
MLKRTKQIVSRRNTHVLTSSASMSGSDIKVPSLVSDNSSATGTSLDALASSILNQTYPQPFFNPEKFTDDPPRLLSQHSSQYSLDDDDLYPVDIIDELYDFFGYAIHSLDIDESQYRYRQSVVQRLLDSEAEYNAKLKVALDRFKMPLQALSRRQSSNQHGSATTLAFLATSIAKPSLLRLQDIETLFGNLDEIYTSSSDLIQSLEERFCIWGPTQLLSDILLSMIPKLRAYAVYFDNYKNSMLALERLEKNPQMKKYLEYSTVEFGILHLHTLLEQPLYTISRYADILEDLLKHTDPQHPDAVRLTQCFARVARVESGLAGPIHKCHLLNQVVRLSIQTRQGFLLTDVPRIIVKQGELWNLHRHLDRRVYVLMSDMLLYFKPRAEDNHLLQYKGKIDLACAMVGKLKTDKVLYGIDITIHQSDPSCAYSEDINALLSASGSSPPQHHYLKANSADEQEAWFEAIESVILRLQRRN